MDGCGLLNVGLLLKVRSRGNDVALTHYEAFNLRLSARPTTFRTFVLPKLVTNGEFCGPTQ